MQLLKDFLDANVKDVAVCHFSFRPKAGAQTYHVSVDGCHHQVRMRAMADGATEKEMMNGLKKEWDKELADAEMQVLTNPFLLVIKEIREVIEKPT